MDLLRTLVRPRRRQADRTAQQQTARRRRRGHVVHEHPLPAEQRSWGARTR